MYSSLSVQHTFIQLCVRLPEDLFQACKMSSIVIVQLSTYPRYSSWCVIDFVIIQPILSLFLATVSSLLDPPSSTHCDLGILILLLLHRNCNLPQPITTPQRSIPIQTRNQVQFLLCETLYLWRSHVLRGSLYPVSERARARVCLCVRECACSERDNLISDGWG